jgi:hypothetical protein
LLGIKAAIGKLYEFGIILLKYAVGQLIFLLFYVSLLPAVLKIKKIDGMLVLMLLL